MGSTWRTWRNSCPVCQFFLLCLMKLKSHTLKSCFAAAGTTAGNSNACQEEEEEEEGLVGNLQILNSSNNKDFRRRSRISRPIRRNSPTQTTNQELA